MKTQNHILRIGLSCFFFFAAAFGFGAACWLLAQELSESQPPENSEAVVPFQPGVPIPPEADPVPACEKMIAEDAFYSDVYDILFPWITDPQSDSPSLARAVELCRISLDRLGRSEEIDPFLEKTVEAHPNNWRVLAAAASQYAALPDWGGLHGETFIRGLGGIESVSAAARDRVTALRLFVRAMDLLEKQRAAESVEPKLVYDFYSEFARVCGDVQNQWPLLQELTDLETLPDYGEAHTAWSVRHWAPVDENGNPVFYGLPESFETAKNDGQRWRFLLEKAASSGAPDAAEARLVFANFLMDQFGSQTLADSGYLWEGRGSETGERRESSLAAIGSLTTLSDHETIARLANGIKRFILPEGQNPLSIYRSVMDDEQATLDARTRAASDLGRAYMNRRQYVKAEEVYRKMAELEVKSQVPEPERFAKRELDMLNGNYGAFAPIPTQTARADASFLWLFRNGRKVRFRVQEIDVRLFLKDAAAYLQEAAKNPPEDWNGDKVRLENIGWKLLNDPETARKYLSSDIADWSVDLEPAPGHQDAQIRIDFPVEKPGAYLLRGKMENGNSDAIVVWLCDTAILKKQVQGKTFWYVADAKTGAPVPDAEIRFFGFTVERIAARREGTSSTGSENTRWRVRTDEKTMRVNPDGWVMTDAKQLNPRLHWLAEAATSTEEGTGRFAVCGFENVWYDHAENSFFRLDRACFLSDRPIYRPNDTVHFRFQAATSRYDLPETWTWQGQPARLVVTGPGGKELVSKEIALDETGGWEDTLETDETFNLGTYTFRLDVLNDSARRSPSRTWRSIGTGRISLEEYRKPEFEVTVETPETPVSLGGKFTVKARADYYFGSPVTRARARWRVIRSRAETVFYPVRRWDWLYGNGYGWLAPDAPWYPGWQKWAVSCPIPYRPYRGESAEIVDSGESELGEDGTVEIPIDTSVAAQLYPDTDHSYEVIVEVTDASRRLVQGSGKVLVVKKPFKVTTWAHRGFYLPQSQIDYTVSARRADGKPVSGRGLVTVSRVRLVQDSDDPEKRSAEETPVLSEEMTIGTEGEGTISFTLSEPGLYRFVCAVDDGGGHRAEGGSLITVTGPNGALAEESAGSNPIDLVLEKPEYRPGEKARLRVSTPAPDATVLLFVRSEEGNAGSPELLRLRGGSAFYELEITDADMPNIWVEAVTIANGRFYSASKNIPVPPATRVLDVAVTPDQASYKPGEHAVMKIRVTDPDGNPVAGVITAAVYDRSLDGLISRGALDLKKFFWDWTRRCSARQQHTLERLFYPIDFAQKSTMQPLGIFDNLLDEEDLLYSPPVMKNSLSRSVAALSGAVGGVTNGAAMPAPAAAPMLAAGEAAELAVADDAKGFGEGGAEAPIQIRSEFADTALWAGQVKTDENGEAELSFDMPENITSWKVRVWSFAPGTRVGEGESETVTRKNLILRMQRPRFLTQTDTVLLSAVVHNYTSSEQETQVTLSAGGEADGTPLLKLHGGTPATQEVLIPAGGQARVDWQIDAVLAGSVPLVMTARSADDADGVRESIPIYLHGIKKQEAVSGMIPPAPEGDTQPREYQFRMTVPAQRIADQTFLTVRYSPTLAGAMLDAIPYLTDYPYGCTEQTLNRFLPTVLVRKLLTDSGIDLAAIESHIANLNPQELGDPQTRRAGWQKPRLDIFGEPVDDTPRRNPVFSSAEVTRRVEEGISRLKELQCGDGGWGWFGGWGERSDPHLTALVTGGLCQARNAGLDVPNDVLGGGIEWLKQYLFNEHAKLRKGKENARDPNRKPDPDAKTAVTPDDVLVYSTLQEWETEKRNEEYEQMITEMGDFIYEDRASLLPYTLSLYGIALAVDIDEKSLNLDKEKNSEAAQTLADSIETDRDRLDTIVRMLRQYVKTDEANQTAWLDLSGSGMYRWFWFGSEIETEAAFLRLLDFANREDPLLPQLVKHLLNSRKNACYWDSTRDTAYCLAAFCEYLEHSPELAAGGTVEIYVDGTLVKTETITPENVFEIDNTLVLSGSEIDAGTHEIRIRYTGAGPLYCNGYLANFTLEPFIRKAGLETEITRTYWKLTEDDSAEETAIVSGGALARQRVQKYKRERLEDGASVKSGDLIEVELNVLSRNNYESILIEDRKPAGFEPVDPVSGYRNGAYVEYRDARVCFFVHHLNQGTHTMRYRLRAETPGTVSALPATVEGMYAPELRGNSDEFQTTIAD